jgi:hypothetical protein
MTKNGRRREVPMNDASYGAVVGLRPKGSGRVFKTRYIKNAYNNAVEAAQLTTSPSIPSGTRLRPGPSCEESRSRSCRSYSVLLWP